MPVIGGKKVSTSLIILAACVLGIGLGVFMLNFWHTTKCSSDRSPEQMEDLIEALNRRLLQAESQVQKNELFMNKVLHTMQSNLLKLELSEYEELSRQSKDEAIQIALFLSSHPAPPMPTFAMDPTYTDAEKLADVIDDVFGKGGDDKRNSFTSEYLDAAEEEEEREPAVTLTDAEASKICTEWKDTYKVAIGISWGDLPYDLQQKWLSYSCDYHLKSEVEEEGEKWD